MNKYIRTVSLGSIFVLSFMAIMVVSPNNAKAANDATEYVNFRIDTELDVLNAKGVTVEWSCNGSASGSFTDNTASESAGGLGKSLDGIVNVASSSAEWTASTCIFAGASTMRGKVSIDGWVTRRWTQVLAATISYSGAFTTRASQDYLFVVNGAQDELGNVFTMTGTSTATTTTASASYSGTTASSSYSGDKWYFAPTADGIITGGKDGYVNKTCTVATWGLDYQTASRSGDFGLTAVTNCDGVALPFGHKVQVYQHGSTFADGKLIGGTVTAGDSYGTTCTIGTAANAGYWYCPVPLTNTATLAKYSGGQLQITTGVYADRVLGSDAQTMAVIIPISNISGGDTPDPTPTSTPTPDATPVPDASPTPTPSITPTPTPSATPVVSVLAKLYRKASDPKVWVMGNDGKLTWVKTLEEFNAAGYKWSDVLQISGSEFAKLGLKNMLGVKKGVILNIRKTASTTAKIIGKMKLNDSYEKTGQSGVWYKINFNGQDGWVHSNYTVTK